MRILINGVIYDSTETPIVIEFDVNEQSLFNDMKKFVSAPADYTEGQRNELMNKSLEKLEKEHHRKLLHNEMKGKTNISEEDFYNWIEKAQRDGAKPEEIVDYINKHMIKEFHEAPKYITDYIKSQYRVFNNEYNRNHSKKLELENKVMRNTLKQIESWTRNPREYEPSLYSINHMCREVLELNKGWKENKNE